MARKMLVMDDSLLEDLDELGACDGLIGRSVEGDVATQGNVEYQRTECYTEDEGDEEELRNFNLQTMLNEVIVGEESYKTPTKGKSSVSKSLEIEEFPNVEVSLPPLSVGMVFSSWQKIDSYFRSYGKQEGFGVVRSSGATIGKGSNAKQKRSVTWTCECYGEPARNCKKSDVGLVSDAQISDEVCVRRKSKKVHCPVKVYAKLNALGEWVIDKAHLKHEHHNPTPGKSKNITKFRKKFLMENPHILEQVLNDRRAGVPIAQIYHCMARKRNGREAMQFTTKDLHDEVAKRRKLIFEEGDANIMFAYFKKMTEDNSDFFHNHRVDELGRLQDVVWVDARSRVAFEEFGDVVVFDSTYLTNEYKLPFCNFVGVNHHGQTILFGCALVSRETSETFEWVFSNWISCMGEKQPIGILTDQDPAMRKALKHTMKGTTHRWCIWHITQKFAKKLGMLPNYNQIRDDLENVIYDSIDSDEFELNWPLVIEKHKLEDDEWLRGFYAERSMWVPAYVKHLFWAGEKRADDNNDRYLRQAYSEFPADLMFRKIYTDSKYKEVQRECNRIIYVSGVSRTRVSETVTEHVLDDRVWYKPKGEKKEKPSKRKREYKLLYDRSSNEVSCDCHHFECHGIVCRHMIKVYEMNNVYEIPEKYILRRWRKDVIRKHTRVKVMYHDPSKTEEVCRYDKMMVRFGSLSSKASAFPETTEVVMQGLQLIEVQLNEKIDMIARKKCAGDLGTPTSVCGEKESSPSTQREASCGGVGEDAAVKDPPIPKRPAHRTTDSRFKSCIEKKKKPRTTKATQASGKKGANSINHTPIQQNHFQWSPCVAAGGIQMTDMDGSVGYFTVVDGVGQQYYGSHISPPPGFYVPYHHFPHGQIPMGAGGWQTPSSAMSYAPGQRSYVPILPRPMPPITPPPHAVPNNN